MQLFQFSHDTRVRPGCCGWRTQTTYWPATSREKAKQEMKKHSDGDVVHGLCGSCMAGMLASNSYEITEVDA